MDAGILLPVLALVTLGIVLVVALRDRKDTEKRLHNPNEESSSLASDGPNHRVKKD